MKKKKYLIGLALAALSMTTLVACGDVTIVNNNGDSKTDTTPTTEPTPTPEPKADSITINVSNKEYDGNPTTATATAVSGKNVKLEYKLEREADSEYSTTAPTEPGRYVVKATTEENTEYKAETTTTEFKISTDMLPDEDKQYENTSAYVKVTNAKQFLDAIYDAKYTYTSTQTGVTKSEGYKVIAATTVRKNETNWLKFVTKGLYLKNALSCVTTIRPLPCLCASFNILLTITALFSSKFDVGSSTIKNGVYICQTTTARSESKTIAVNTLCFITNLRIFCCGFQNPLKL